MAVLLLQQGWYKRVFLCPVCIVFPELRVSVGQYYPSISCLTSPPVPCLTPTPVPRITPPPVPHRSTKWPRKTTSTSSSRWRQSSLACTPVSLRWSRVPAPANSPRTPPTSWTSSRRSIVWVVGGAVMHGFTVIQCVHVELTITKCKVDTLLPTFFRFWLFFSEDYLRTFNILTVVWIHIRHKSWILDETAH